MLAMKIFSTLLPMQITHILLVASLALVRHWKTVDPPLSSEIINAVHIYCTYKIILASSRGKCISASSIWEPWITWYKSRSLM